MTNRGFTLIEILIATMFGSAMLLGMMFLPLDLMDVYVDIDRTTNNTMDFSLFSYSMYNDIEKGIVSVDTIDGECFRLENLINYQLDYCFSEDGIFKIEDGNYEYFSDTAGSYSLAGNILTVTIINKNLNKTRDYVFLLDYPVFRVDGE